MCPMLPGCVDRILGACEKSKPFPIAISVHYCMSLSHCAFLIGVLDDLHPVKASIDREFVAYDSIVRSEPAAI